MYAENERIATAAPVLSFSGIPVHPGEDASAKEEDDWWRVFDNVIPHRRSLYWVGLPQPRNDPPSSSIPRTSGPCQPETSMPSKGGSAEIAPDSRPSDGSDDEDAKPVDMSGIHRRELGPASSFSTGCGGVTGYPRTVLWPHSVTHNIVFGHWQRGCRAMINLPRGLFYRPRRDR